MTISRGRQLLLAALAGGILLGGLLPWYAAWADSRGLVITKDGDNINVTIDPSLISDVMIKRSDGHMQIQVMDDHLTGNAKPADVVVDSPLKASDTVQVQSSGKGKTVTINSSKVFLSIQELSEQTLAGAKSATAAAPKPPEQKPATTKPATPVATATKPSAITVAPAKATPVAVTPKPVEKTAAKTDKPKESAPPKQTATKPVATTKPVVSLPPMETAKKPASVATTSAKAAPAAAAPIRVVSVQPVESDSSTAATEPPVAETPAAPVVKTGPAIPLDQIQKQQEANSPISFGWILRLLVSLVLVLALVLGFLKVVLPKLLEKYPQWAEMFKQQTPISLHSALRSAPDAPAPLTAAGIVARAQEKAPEEPVIKNLPAPPPAYPYEVQPPDEKLTPSPKAERMSKKAFLEHWGKRQDQFRILTSSKIGRGKELHLVEIKGHHLVIATTPFTVNFITELKDTEGGGLEAVSGLDDRELATLGGDSEHAVVRARLEPSQDNEHAPAPENTTHAYLVDHLQEKQQQRQQQQRQSAILNPALNPNDAIYLADPEPENRPKPRVPENIESMLPESAFEPMYHPLEEKPAEYWSQSPDRALYKKYLFPDINDVKRQHEPVSSAPATGFAAWRKSQPSEQAVPLPQEAPKKSVRPASVSITAPAAGEPAYVDAEEVVVLEDYDDEYVG